MAVLEMLTMHTNDVAGNKIVNLNSAGGNATLDTIDVAGKLSVVLVLSADNLCLGAQH